MRVCQLQGNTRRRVLFFFLKGITQAGIMLLCIMETDLALLLACMPMVEQCSREGSVGTSTCAESTPHRAVQTLLTSLCIYLFILFCFRFAAFCSTLSVECLWLKLRLERTFRQVKKAVAAARQLCSLFVADPYLTLRELFTYFSRAQLNTYASQWCPL